MIRIHDPDGVLIRRATRVAIVMPIYFWVCFIVLDRPVAALFGSFASFALLAMGDFGGPLPRRALAYLVVAAVGAVLVAVGTLASASIPVAIALMLVVGFSVAYVGALGGYYVAAGPALTLAYVLASTVAAPAEQVPERVLGWTGAGIVAAIAAVSMWPVHERRRIGEAMADGCRRVAAALRTDDEDSCASARDAVAAARLRFWSSPRRPAGPSEHDRAVLHLLDALDWLGEILRTPGGLRGADDELLDRTADALDACAVGIERAEPVAVEPIEAARGAHLARLHREVREAIGSGTPVDDVVDRIRRSFLPRVASHAADVAARAATAARVHPTARSVAVILRRATHLLRAHLHVRSVWFRNSLRMGVALAVAVTVALAGDFPHAFWVALGTLTALRSNALGTGRTVAAALIGTVVGFAVSIGVLALAGDHLVLWLVLPIAVFLSAWAPTALSFIVGQASFTVFVVVLFNLIDAIGWRVGEQRVVDIALGCGVGLLVSVIFWPRGASAQLRRALVESVTADGRWFTAEIDRVLRVGVNESGESLEEEATARAAQWRADQALIVYLDERGSHRLPVARAQALVNSGDFLQLAASSTATGSTLPVPASGACRTAVDEVAVQADAAVLALATVTAEGPLAAIDAPTTTEIDTCLARLSTPLDEGAVDTAVRLVFAVEWVRRVDDVARRLTLPSPAPDAGAVSSRARPSRDGTR